MATLRLHIDRSRLTVGHLMDIEDLADPHGASVRKLHDVLLPFVVDAKQQPLTPERASAAVRALTAEQLGETVEELQRQLGALETAAVPPTTGSA